MNPGLSDSKASIHNRPPLLVVTNFGRSRSGHGKRESKKGKIAFMGSLLGSTVLCLLFPVISLLLPLPLSPTVCQNCMEVDLMAVAAIIVADVCITLGLLLLVYYWSKNKKASSVTMMRGPGAGGRPRGKTAGFSRKRVPPKGKSSRGGKSTARSRQLL